MPLNPNGKVDKPALPFPDTAQLAAASRQSKKEGLEGEIALSPTQKQVREIWLEVIPHGPRDLAISDNFFDVGGHSILATRVVFEIRKRFAIDLPLGILFRQPTIAGLSEEIDVLRGDSLDVGSRPPSSHLKPTSSYSDDARELMERLAASYEKPDRFRIGEKLSVFLTGATGFLGAFLIRDLLSRPGKGIKVIAHVRARSTDEGIQRVKNSCEAYGVWREEWIQYLEVVTGSLEDEYLGLSAEMWDRVKNTADVVIHNGAMVQDLLINM